MTTSPQIVLPASLSLFGLPVNRMTQNDLIELVADAVNRHERYVIGNHNLHSIYLSFHEPRMREFYRQADFVHVDGMSLVLLGRVLGLPLRRTDRTGYMDLLPPLLRRATESGWRIFYLGSKPGVAEHGADILRKDFPQLEIRTRHGYFDTTMNSDETRDVLEEIRCYDPHIVLVGMGMPRQELWVLENGERIQANAVFCCGALIDYIAGVTPTPPRWLGQIGLEWFYRLIAEPRRLSHRYLVEPWYVLGFVIRELIRQWRSNVGNADSTDA
jgi:N-acetylglucosaminyldiphosphoundecaprenol N-acetyl-beta-D-mannosaminyltransferase